MTSHGRTRKDMSHASYPSANILFYFGATNFLQGAFSSPRPRPLHTAARSRFHSRQQCVKSREYCRKTSLLFNKTSRLFHRLPHTRPDASALWGEGRRKKCRSRAKSLHPLKDKIPPHRPPSERSAKFASPNALHAGIFSPRRHLFSSLSPQGTDTLLKTCRKNLRLPK